MRKASLLLILILHGLCVKTYAQNPYIRHYTTLDGLPSNTIYQIYQDSQKLIWFTSDAGVSRFDGSHFTNYRKKDGLSSNDVVRIKEDNRGRIWLFNYNGSVNYIHNNKVYNGKNASFLNSLVGSGFILDFYTDPDQTIYFYNWQRELFSLNKNGKVSKDYIFKNSAKESKYIRNNINNFKIIYLSRNLSDEWVIWANGGVYSQDKNQKKIA